MQENEVPSAIKNNRSESDLCSSEATFKSSCKESPEKIRGFNGIQTHDLHNTGAMLYQLSYEAL